MTTVCRHSRDCTIIPSLNTRKGTCSMSTEANKVLVRRYREAHNTNNLALLDEIVAADIKSHKGEHYANVYTSVPRPCGCRLCWLHHI